MDYAYDTLLRGLRGHKCAIEEESISDANRAGREAVTLTEKSMCHVHFCDVGGHEWICDGQALRPFSGDSDPSICVCMACQLPMESGDHSNCPIELVACPEHVHQEQDSIKKVEDFLRAPEGIYMSELFAKRDALADDDPEKDAVVAEILRHTFDCAK